MKKKTKVTAKKKAAKKKVATKKQTTKKVAKKLSSSGSKLSDKNKIIELLEKMIEDRNRQIAWLSKNCDALADEVRRLTGKKTKSKAQTKPTIKPNKQKVGFLKKHKYKK